MINKRYCTLTVEQMQGIVEHLAEFIRRSNTLGGRNGESVRYLQIAKASIKNSVESRSIIVDFKDGDFIAKTFIPVTKENV